MKGTDIVFRTCEKCGNETSVGIEVGQLLEDLRREGATENERDAADVIDDLMVQLSRNGNQAHG